jgi:protein SCO1/2
MAKRNFPKVIYWLILMAVALALLIAYLFIKYRQQSNVDLPILGQVPEFQFIDSHGQPFGLSNMQGKVCVVDFIFTRCPDLCPMMSAKLADLYKEYSEYKQIQFISITVDPGYDSLSVLRQYAVSFGVADNRWVFLYGPIGDIVRLSEKGFMLAADDLPEGHSSKFILVDQKSQIRGYYDSDSKPDLALLKKHLNRLTQ